VAVTAPKKLDAHALRADFPIFEQRFHGKPLAYLDSAASSQKPRQMLEAMTHFYETSYANVHRGVYELAERATEALEHARERCRAFVNAPVASEIVFVRNATEAINLVAYSWGLSNLGPGDVVLVTELEHHANFVPWQFIARKTGAGFRMLPVNVDGTLRLEELDELAGDANVKVVATGYVSNVLGGSNDVPRIAAWARSTSVTPRRPRRTSASTCRRSVPTSSRSAVTRCLGRAASASCGARRSSCSRWIRSSPAGT